MIQAENRKDTLEVRVTAELIEQDAEGSLNLNLNRDESLIVIFLSKKIFKS